MKDMGRRQAIAMVFLAVAAAACSSTQPDRISTRTGSLSFSVRAKVLDYDCYELWQDTSNPLDGTPDVDLGIKQCYDLPGAPVFNDTAIPWHYSLLVTIIRAGTTFEDILISDDGVFGTTLANGDPADDYISMTDYDFDEVASPLRPPEADTLFLNGKRVSRGNKIFQTANSTACLFCPVDLGDTNVLLGPPHFDFTLNPGDTVLVRARKQPMNLSAGFIPPDPDPQIVLAATLTLGGVPVSVNGENSSTIDDGTGFSFSFTVQ